MVLFGKKKQITSENDQLRARIAYLEENASEDFRSSEAARLRFSKLQDETKELEKSRSHIAN